MGLSMALLKPALGDMDLTATPLLKLPAIPLLAARADLFHAPLCAIDLSATQGVAMVIDSEGFFVHDNYGEILVFRW